MWRSGLRFFTTAGWRKLTGSPLAGSPDLIFPSAHLAVFVDGCFWHGCPDHYQPPDERAEFWRNKLAANRERDIAVNQQLKADGWHVMRLWEHQLRPPRALAGVVDEIWASVRPAGEERATDGSSAVSGPASTPRRAPGIR